MVGAIFRMGWLGNLVAAGTALFIGFHLHGLLRQQRFLSDLSGQESAVTQDQADGVLGLFALLAAFFLLMAVLRLFGGLLGFRRRDSVTDRPEAQQTGDRNRPTGFLSSTTFRLFTILFFGVIILEGILRGPAAALDMGSALPLYFFSLFWLFIAYRAGLLGARSRGRRNPGHTSTERVTARRPTPTAIHHADSPWQVTDRQSPWTESSPPRKNDPEPLPAPARKKGFPTPYSDAVLRKARQDPFERLQRRYRFKRDREG